MTTSLDTRRAAHARVEPSKAETCDQIMAFAIARGNYGITADEVAAAFDCDHNHTSPRISELLDGGRLVKTARTRATRSGSAARVLIAKQFECRLAQARKWIADAREKPTERTLFDIERQHRDDG